MKMGKKILLVAAVLLIGLAGAAYADSVVIKTNLTVAGNAVQLEKEIGFTPTANTFVVNVAGKKCSFGSSKQGNVPKGCSYKITIDGSGVTPSVREADTTCMKSPMSCK